MSAIYHSVTDNSRPDPLLIKWWLEKPLDYQRRFEKAFNQGMQRIELGLVEGESVGELVRAVRGYKSRKDGLYHSGIMDVTKREAEALVRTSVMQVANATRMAIYEANADVMKGYQVVAVLDTRTSMLCRALDGHLYGLDRQPMDGGPPLPPGPPWHFNCRSSLCPWFKSYAELAGSEDLSRVKRDTLADIDKSTRASMNGQVAAKMNYNDWLKTQGEETQLEVLGEARMWLWKKGKLSMSDMIHQNGRPLNIEELKRKNSIR
jgi:SPP1 gp7 family putative phage head morphogenesis protein